MRKSRENDLTEGRKEAQKKMRILQKKTVLTETQKKAQEVANLSEDERLRLNIQRRKEEKAQRDKINAEIKAIIETPVQGELKKLDKIGSMPVVAVTEITLITKLNGRKLGDFTEDVITKMAEKYKVTEPSVKSVSSTAESIMFPEKNDGTGIHEKFKAQIYKTIQASE